MKLFHLYKVVIATRWMYIATGEMYVATGWVYIATGQLYDLMSDKYTTISLTVETMVRLLERDERHHFADCGVLAV